MKFSIKNFFSKCNQMRISSDLYFPVEGQNRRFYTVKVVWQTDRENLFYYYTWGLKIFLTSDNFYLIANDYKIVYSSLKNLMTFH